MAEQAQNAIDAVKDAVENVTERAGELTTQDNAGTAPNLQLDDVTGERVSKSELKKRQKQRDKDAKRAEAAATKKPQPEPKKKAASAEEDEAKLNPNQYFEIRSRAIQKFKQSQQPNP